jgi:multicomponent Na+:H+ antiporter subunit F
MSEALFYRGIEALIAVLTISFALCSLRLYLGPDMPNRTVAFDLISIHAVGIFALFAVRSGSYVLLEGAFVTAVLGFLGTVMFARFLERSQSAPPAPPEPPQEQTNSGD